MVIKPNVLQGFFFGLFGAFAAAILLVSTLMLFPAPHVQAKGSLGDFRGLIVMASCLLVSVSTYHRSLHIKRATLPAWTRAGLFAAGGVFIATVCVVAYLWARGGF